jgi:hypothetical protein
MATWIWMILVTLDVVHIVEQRKRFPIWLLKFQVELNVFNIEEKDPPLDEPFFPYFASHHNYTAITSVIFLN